MHAKSHRSDFFACSSGVNIYNPAICCTITVLSAVTGVVFASFHIPTAMSDSQSVNTSMPEVMISSKNECDIIRDLSEITLQIVFDAWWASTNVQSKHLIAWNNSRQAPSWRFYLLCGIEETGSPGIICVVCHQVLRHPSEYGTSSMRKHLFTKLTSQS